MRHSHHILMLWYHEACPPCRVRRLRYGYRLDPAGQRESWYGTMNDKRLTTGERIWIAAQVKPCEIER